MYIFAPFCDCQYNFFSVVLVKSDRIKRNKLLTWTGFIFCRVTPSSSLKQDTETDFHGCYALMDSRGPRIAKDMEKSLNQDMATFGSLGEEK